MNNRRMELLAPAGDMDALIAAVQSGADAVYLGAGAFNARRHAGNFDGDGLKTAVDYCHARGVKVHVTLNTLVRQDELPALFDAIRLVNASGADAAIVQDFGVARALRQIAPEIELHASTQMAAHNAQATRFLMEQGFDRVVLAREATWADMADCAACGIDVEVFVHGALCVACSGQCLMSSLVGGRSGNRGLCAQPCRLPWKLDGREGYLLSTKDLCAIDDLPRLREAGVRSLKIEGRMKRAEYVAVTVAAYRRALDALYAGEPFDTAPVIEDLRQMFNRGGFTRGYAPGIRESELMYPDRPNHIGVEVGACRAAGKVMLEKALENADALVLRASGEDRPVKLSGAAGETVRCPQARKGDRLVRLVSEAQMRDVRSRVSTEHRARPVCARLTLRVGQPARLTVSDGRHAAEATGDIAQAATGRPFDPERAKSQLQKTGGTAWRVEAVEFDADANAFAPASLLNGLRRDALNALEKAQFSPRDNHPLAMPRLSAGDGGCPSVACGDSSPLRWGAWDKFYDLQLPPHRSGEVARRAGGAPSPLDAGKPRLIAQASDPDVLKAALQNGADLAAYCPDDLRALDASALPDRFALAVPAVLTAEALDALNRWANEHAERIVMTYLSNIGHFALSWPGEPVGDYMLNVGNDFAVAQLQDWGLTATTPSVELTAPQAAQIGGKTHLVMWGRIPLMYLRHCPLRAARGMKGLHADCRHCDACPPDDRLNARTLIDRRGAAFPLNRVAMPGGCVVQVLNSVPLMPLKKLDKMPQTAAWRLLLRGDEPVEAVVRVYRAALDGRDFKGMPEWAELDSMNTTAGHYFRGVE